MDGSKDSFVCVRGAHSHVAQKSHIALHRFQCSFVIFNGQHLQDCEHLLHVLGILVPLDVVWLDLNGLPVIHNGLYLADHLGSVLSVIGCGFGIQGGEECLDCHNILALHRWWAVLMERLQDNTVES